MSRSPIVTLTVFAALLACKDPDPRCSAVTGQIPGKLSLADCSDRHRREVSCEPWKGSDGWMCACERNGELGRTFNWPTTRTVEAKERRELEEVLSRQCHWSVRLH